MHRYKNKKLHSIIIASLITYISFNANTAYATSINDNEHNLEEEIIPQEDNENEIKEISIKEINNEINLGTKVKVKGNILKIEGSEIYIKDESDEGLIILKNISIKNLKENDLISVVGIVEEKENTFFISVNIVNDISLIESSYEEGIPQPEEELEDKNESFNNNQVNKPDNMSNSLNSNGDINLQTDKSSSNSKTNEVTQEIIVAGIKAKEPIVINSDLTDKQWELIKENIELKTIKAKDLKNNTIRITKINENSGDKIWIVNDPRNLYNESIKNTIGDEIADVLLYSEYNISETSWKNIITDVKSGDAKIKYDSDKNIKVIYNNSDSKDTIIIIQRKA